MDARDFNQEPPVIEGGKYLEKIYDLQRELINHYTKIEAIPDPPLNVNTKSSQVLFKDFIGRVIEELSEGYESLEAIMNLAEKNDLWMGARYSITDLAQVMNHLQNAGEEMADAMHFMVELLIYANIMPEDILAYLKQRIPTTDALELLSDNAIALAMIEGSKNTHIYRNHYASHSFDLVEKYEKLLEEADHDDININKISNPMLYACGRRFSRLEYIHLFKPMLWDVTHHLNIARNFLKNKPWKQSQMMTNEQAFQESIVKAFNAMMGLFYAMGLDYKSIYLLYYRKNLSNQFRIRSKY